MALMTVRAAAAKLGIGYSTLKQWIHKGRVRSIQTEGGHHRIDDAEIERLKARRGPARKASASNTPRPIEGLSARNQLFGFVEEVRVDGLLG